MTEQHQIAIFEAMESPDFYPHAVSTIEQRDTHISKVFLTGNFAYKIKKPINLEFLDFTTLEKRRHFCRQEIHLNRRLAPDVYLDVVPIILKDGCYHMTGAGNIVEYAVKMRQLPESSSMLQLVRRRKLENGSIDELASVLAKFYSRASTSESINMDLPFESGIYSKEASSLTYGKLVMLAQEVIEKGGSVILDATFSRRHQRDEVIRLARDMDANIIFIECFTSYEMLKKRLADREKTVCISDARLRHLKQLKAHFESSDELQNDMHLKINTEESIDACMRQILSHDYFFLTQQTARAMKNSSP